MPMAVTRFGQTIDAGPGQLAAVGRYTSLAYFDRSESIGCIGTVGIRSDFVMSTETTPKLPFESRARIVTVDSSPEGADTIAVHQYRHAKTGARIPGIDLFHLLFGASLAGRTRTANNGFALNEVQAAAPESFPEYRWNSSPRPTLFSGALSDSRLTKRGI